MKLYSQNNDVRCKRSTLQKQTRQLTYKIHSTNSVISAIKKTITAPHWCMMKSCMVEYQDIAHVDYL
jgi:hypothetical protein